MEGKHSVAANVTNLCILVASVVLPVLALCFLRSRCDFGSSRVAGQDYWTAPLGPEAVCTMYYNNPIAFTNFAYFVYVDVGFWLVYLVQQSTWLIDPHWQFIPLLIAGHYYTHPTAVLPARAWAMLALLLAWAARLTHNYLRRERWQFGHREDWRYEDMRARFGGFFCVVSFFAVSVAQHPMLVGMTLPLCAATQGAPTAMNLLDGLAFLCCAVGICVAAVADNQLFAYMEMGVGKPIVLDTGLWRYSRHPNHFGEQLWWVGLALFGVSAADGAGWPLLGVLYNHPIDTFATLRLIEGRMLRRPERVEAYTAYQARTSLLLPWPPRGNGYEAAASLLRGQ